MVGWVFVNVSNLFKGKKAEKISDPFSADDSFADVPSSSGDCASSASSASSY